MRLRPTNLRFQRVIQRAIMHVQSTSNGKREVTGANVLVAIFGEKDSHAVYYLHQQGVSRLDIVNFIAHGISKTQPNVNVGEEGAVENDTQKAGSQAASTGQKPTPLDQYTQDLNKRALDETLQIL